MSKNIIFSNIPSHLKTVSSTNIDNLTE